MKDKPHNMLTVTFLIATAIWIWMRDLTWMETLEDTIPILLALPIAWWLGQPWQRRSQTEAFAVSSLSIGIGIFVLGVLTNMTLLMTLGWVHMLFRFIQSLYHVEGCPLKRLMILPLLAFPWIANDFSTIGWRFRLSGAWLSARLFSFAGLAVDQQGTFVTVEGLPVSVEAACSGLNLLQSLLIAGTALALLKLPYSPRFWLAILLLPLIAWATNTIRIIFITVLALTFGIEFASGLFHTWGGLLVIVLMFVACWELFKWLKTSTSNQSKPVEP